MLWCVLKLPLKLLVKNVLTDSFQENIIGIGFRVMSESLQKLTGNYLTWHGIKEEQSEILKVFK